MNPATEPEDLRPLQLFFLAGAVFVVSAGYGALLPLLPAWLAQQVPGLSLTEVNRQVGFLSGAYAAGVLVGAPVWGWVADRLGRPHILIAGLIGYVASLMLLLLPSMASLWAIYALRIAAGVFIAAVLPLVPALVAAHTPTARRARRFAWLGAASLLGFLFGPGLVPSRPARPNRMRQAAPTSGPCCGSARPSRSSCPASRSVSYCKAGNTPVFRRGKSP